MAFKERLRDEWKVEGDFWFLSKSKNQEMSSVKVEGQGDLDEQLSNLTFDNFFLSGSSEKFENLLPSSTVRNEWKMEGDFWFLREGLREKKCQVSR